MSGRRDSWTEMRTRSYIGKANFQSAATTSNISLTQEWVITAVQAPPNESYGGVWGCIITSGQAPPPESVGVCLS